jgi:hypothetical protein
MFEKSAPGNDLQLRIPTLIPWTWRWPDHLPRETGQPGCGCSRGRSARARSAPLSRLSLDCRSPERKTEDICCSKAHLKVTWGRCYDHNFLWYLIFFGRKNWRFF